MGTNDADVGQLHQPAVKKKFGSRFGTNLSTADGADADDAVIKTRDALAEKKPALKTSREFVAGARDESGVVEKGVLESGVEQGKFLEMSLENAADFGFDNGAWKSGVEAFERLFGGRFALKRIDVEFAAEGFGHR